MNFPNFSKEFNLLLNEKILLTLITICKIHRKHGYFFAKFSQLLIKE